MEDEFMPAYVIDPSMLQLKDYFRNEGVYFDPKQAYAGKNNLFTIKLHHGGKFTPKPSRMYHGGKVHYVDNIDADLFNVEEMHRFLKDLGYDPEQLMFYHYKLPNKGLDYGLRPLGCDSDVVCLLKLVATCKVVEVFVEYWLSSIDHQLLSSNKSTVEIEEIDDELMNAPLTSSSKRLALCWINEVPESSMNAELNVVNEVPESNMNAELNAVNEVPESSMNAVENVLGDASVGMNDHPNDMFYFEEHEHLNPADYTVYANEKENPARVNEDEHDRENELGNEDEHDRENELGNEDEHDRENELGNEDEHDREDFIVDEEHVIDEVEVNMEGFSFSVQEPAADPNVTPNVDLTDEALEVLDFDSFDSDVGEDNASSRRRKLRKLKNSGGQQSAIVNNLYVGQEFANKKLAKIRIKAYAVETRRKIGIVKNDSERLQARCKGNVQNDTQGNISHGHGLENSAVSQEKGKGLESSAVSQEKGKGVKLVDKDKIQCPWKVYISVGDNLKWVVRTLNESHLCQQSRKIGACTSTFLSEHVVDLLQHNPEIKITSIQQQMQKQFQVGVSRDQAFRAKAKAEVQMRGDQEQQYGLLWDYCEALKKANPNTTVKIDVYRAHNPRQNVRRFKRIYVCLGGLKAGFRASGRQLLGLDGAFMKGNYPGQLITAVSVDANNGIYPLAYGIVESESKDSWMWFLSCLGDDLDLEANSNFTFITDRQKGLLPALATLYPAAEHRYCVRHIHDNMSSIYKGGQYKELLWKCATATTETHFERAMDELKSYNRLAHEWVRKIPPEHWSRSGFSGRAKCDLLINNICEVFNRQLLDARDNPVISCLEYVREYLMKRIVIVQSVIEKSQGILTPTVTKIFNVIKEKASQCDVVWNGADLFQVNQGRQNQVVVNLSDRTCSCRKWEVFGIPCKHAVACIFNMNDNGMEFGISENWVHHSMRLDTWKTVYSHKINPVPGREFWAKSKVPTRLIPPYIPPQVGRPGKKRKKSAGEVAEMVINGKLSKKGGTVTCKSCGEKGHNKRGCKGGTTGSASNLFKAFSGPPAGQQSHASWATPPTRQTSARASSGSASQPNPIGTQSASANPPNARASQPTRGTQGTQSASVNPPNTRGSQSAPKKNSGSQAAKKLPTRQSQRQKAGKKN